MPPWRSAGSDAETESRRYAGQYLLEDRLGSGGMGVVHLARSASGLRLAVKVVHGEFAQDPEFRGRFRQEVAAARRVSGAFTAPVVDADPDAGQPWMATLFIPGPTLSEYVKRNGALPAARLRQLMAGLAEALRDIHRAGVVHRDLKPSNVLLAEDGPKVIDFGISRPSDSELRTETGKLIGTPPFMAPEQFRRPREVGPAADVFALGSVIVHAATGSGPFDSDSPYLLAYQVVHEEPDLTGVPAELAPLVTRCLAKEPEDRPTADELMAELRALSASYDTQMFVPEPRAVPDGGGPAAPHGSGPAEPDAVPTHRRQAPVPAAGDAGREPRAERKRRARRGPWTAAVAAAAVLALAGGAVALVRAGDGPAPAAQRKDKPFRAWETDLRAPGAEAGGVPQCTASAGTLYCARPGVLAAAVDPADGSVEWARAGAGGQDPDGVAVPPTLSGGLLHVLDRGGSRLAALDPATGDTRWSHDVTAHEGRITHVDGVVLLTGPDSRVTALDAATGEQRWQRTVGGLKLPSFQTYGDGVAYAVEPDGADGTRVTGVDPRTGAVRLEQRLDGALSLVGARDGVLWFTSTAEAYDDTDAVIRHDTGDGGTRRIRLSFPVGGAQAVVHGDTVHLLGAVGTLVAVDTRAGVESWRLETSVSFPSAPVVAGQRIYFSAGDGRLIAVDAAHGRPSGQTPARAGEGRGSLMSGLSLPVAAGGEVFAGAPDGTLFGVSGDPAGW
ncbi:PQQ-binding-like beta-propeller repeat protein [Streptomyces sp. NPDC006610]|uniref:serine/threonine-protein kinase n=1 Tax=Streptomyces sp. NPDC006610 TaxID=3154584 RepID=UPI00339F14EA